MSLLFSQSSVRGSPPGSSAGGLGLEKGTRRRGLELRPGPSSSLLSGLEGPLDGLSPHGPPGRPRPLGAAPTRPGPTADTSPGCSGSVGNRERASERAGGMEEIREERRERAGGNQSRPGRGLWQATPGQQAQVLSSRWLPKMGSGNAGRASLGPRALSPGPAPLLSFVLSLLPSSVQGSIHPDTSPGRTKEAQARPCCEGRGLPGGGDSSSGLKSRAKFGQLR